MLIKEMIERECCLTKDLLPYKGKVTFAKSSNPYFCKHCGEIWVADKEMDAAGSMSPIARRMEARDIVL